MAKKTYKVVSPIRHDGRDHAVDEVIDLDDKTAAGLIEAGAVDPGAIGDTGGGSVIPGDPVKRQLAIVEAIGQMDTENADLWLRDGRPDASAIEEITGWKVTAAERNEAWASMQSQG